MGEATKISWCDHTFNSWWGCEKVSAACDSCYAEAFAYRLGMSIWGKGSDRRFFGDKHWNEPRRWDRKAAEAGVRRRVFCSSMADVFEDRSDLDEHRARLWDLIVETPNLDWLLLTKRPQNVLGFVPPSWLSNPPPNWWQGATVENQRRANERVPLLMAIPAPIRFLSVEPMLGPIDLERTWNFTCPGCMGEGVIENYRCLECDGAGVRANGLQWILIGGESGTKARRTKPEWIKALVAFCDAAGIVPHVKQAGRVLGREWGCADAHGGDDSAYPEWAKRREVPA